MRTYRTLLGILALLIVVISVLTIVPPERVVSLIGVENSYLVAFIVSLLAGVSSFSSTGALATVATLSQGGADPVLLGLSGGVGLFLSDSVFYYLLWRAGSVITRPSSHILDRIEYAIQAVPTWLALALVYIYTAFTPLPNDLLLLALLFGGYRYRTFALPLLFGALTLMLIIAHIGIPWK